MTDISATWAEVFIRIREGVVCEFTVTSLGYVNWLFRFAVIFFAIGVK